MDADTDIDTDIAVALRGWLPVHVPGFRGLRGLVRFAGGQSNPTWRVEADSGTYVLRAKPPGPLLASAHAVDREYRVMAALQGSGVPVPRMLALSGDDGSPLGRAFYVMAHLEGRIFWDPALPDQSPADRAAIYDEMNAVLARLHGLDPAALGLADFGRPGDYFARQTARWSRQYRASVAVPEAPVARLMDWLPAHLPPEDGRPALVHGDFRLDNMIFAPDRPALLGVLDWELSTLGHPLADLAYQCLQWRLPHDGPMRGLAGLDRAALGLPSEDAYVAAYAARRGLGAISHWTFYLAFAAFRLIAILQGVVARAAAGNAADPARARSYGAAIPGLIALATDLTQARA